MRQAALRRHAVAGNEPPVADGLLDVFDDLQVAGDAGGGDPQIPSGRDRAILYGTRRQNFPRCMAFVFE
ncbi:hypothetical protein CBM2637_U10024 [Cupriavidus taiwanensis]|nr:hypothetical protein CBM2637_U10024 [Cupriavidus taiwanensis]